MAKELQRALALSSILLTLVCVSACGKSKASCASTEQCETGFICTMDGVCESLDATVIVVTADAAPACPAASHFCAAPVPTDWAGPVAGTQAGIGSEPAACSGDYGNQVSLVGESLQAEGACGCSCPGTAQNVACGPATVVERNGTGFSDCFQCGLVGSSCQSQAIASNNSCVPIPGNVGDLAAVKVFMGAVEGSGTCTEAAINNDLSSFFASDERYCSANAIPATCENEGLCFPNVEDAAFTAMCIFQSGDHDCPAGYPAKESRFEGIEDTRACAACSCSGPAIGSSCRGSVRFGFNTSQGCEPTTAEVSDTSACIGNPVNDTGLTAARYAPDPDTTCTQSGGEQSGEATATGPVTYCCTEAIAAPVLN